MKMMVHKSLLLLLLLLFSAINSKAQTSSIYKTLSPDKTTSLEVKTAGGKLLYRMLFAAQTVTDWSPLGLQTNRNSGEENMEILRRTQRNNKEKFNWSLGEDDVITNNYNEIRFSCRTTSADFDLVARVYDGSVAFRYELPASAQVSSIKKELTTFNFTDAYTLY